MSHIEPGLLILHGNQMEQLRAAVFSWLRTHPLGALEQETILVQSNGVAEWLKIALAEEGGVCAATRVALPARFLWEAYRGMLGREQVPPLSAFDKGPLTWRLMRLLPALLDQAAFAPLRLFLGDGDPERRLQLAARLADLYDQYQVYRADWLLDWAAGRDQVRDAHGAALALAPEQRWQAALWRAAIDSLPEGRRELGRVAIHEAFLQAAAAGAAPLGRLPRRVVIFGVSALPYQSLQALAALGRHCQVLLAVPNPCQFYWGDIIDGRELLRAEHKRQRQKGADLALLAPEELHAHSHPLLAGWGRQGRDFVRMLDEFDGGATARVDLFSEGPGAHLLGQVQAAVRELLPVHEHDFAVPDATDKSIEFSVAHSAQREVEVLHDQLLSWFVQDPSLRPRDIVVMVPDIDSFSAAIHAVFNQHRRGDARAIPFEIGDVRDRSVNPLLLALEWLLRLPQQRCRQSELRDLLDVPCAAARFGLAAEDLPLLGRWIAGAQVRWGLDQQHRAGLGLGAAGSQNAWLFGLQRMLLGYASGAGAHFQGIEPYAEVGGLDAGLAGSLAQLLEHLLAWRATLAQAHTPTGWGAHARALLAAFFKASDETERITMARLEAALQSWLETCTKAGFDEAVPLAVLREAWLGAYDEPALNHQFVSGGVTFCTLMPMRAVPFRVVCLLGMNDGDFPRRAPKADFDLLALPGMARPGDRSRRDDDRYLMLEAVLAARDKLYVSWVGRNVRDNSEQPPSVLVAQLRDYLAAGWQLDLHALTTEHALQPFSRPYFEDGGPLTYAREWRAAHHDSHAEPGALAPHRLEGSTRISLADLARLLKCPAREFFRLRLGVSFRTEGEDFEDEEPFSLDALQRYQVEAALLLDAGEQEAPAAVRATLEARTASLQRQGALPLGLLGQQVQRDLVEGLLAPRTAWLELCARHQVRAPKLAVSLSLGELALEDWIDQRREAALLLQSASKVLKRPHNLIEAWLQQLASAAMGAPQTAYLAARDSVLTLAPLDPEQSRAQLDALAALWRANLDAPLPTACKTGIAFLARANPRQTYDGGFELSGEVDEPCLARLWPDYQALAAQAQWQQCTEALYGPLLAWIAESVDEGGQP